MKPRTTVYVAMNGLVKVADGINYRQERVTLASDPCVAKYPDAWRELGTVDDDGAAYIVMLGDAAVLPRVWERISPIGAVPVPGAPAGEPDPPLRPRPEPEPDAPPATGDGYLSLAEIEVERHKLARQGHAHGYDALAAQFGKGARSTIRRRYKGLPPPGMPIPNVCPEAPPHQHPEG